MTHPDPELFRKISEHIAQSRPEDFSDILIQILKKDGRICEVFYNVTQEMRRKYLKHLQDIHNDGIVSKHTTDCNQ